MDGFRFIDLFAGIGGMRIAYENVGGTCVYSSEWNKFSQQTYEANFGEKPEGDITKVDAATIPDHDILVCQIRDCPEYTSSRQIPVSLKEQHLH